MTTHVRLHPQSLSPDPLYGRTGRALPDGFSGLGVHPHACVDVHPPQPAVRRWAAGLDLYRHPGSLTAKADATGRFDLILDFGTELEASLELDWSGSACNLFVSFGESLPEALTLGLPTTNPVQTVAWRLDKKGRHRRTFAARGFRFIRIQAHDVQGPLVLHSAVAHGLFMFHHRRGDFSCSDRRFQRVWQTAAYTARICARPDSFWDGIKRDRNGWFGDARITQQATDAVFHEPGPAAAMLVQLPTDKWTMGVPGFSFDAVAMLRQFVLCHGVDHPAVREAYARTREFLAWVRATQTTRQGFIKRDPKAQFFGSISFVDWSPLPIGGKFEELSWLQCKHLEALRYAGEIAGWLGEEAHARDFARRAQVLAGRIVKTFWRGGRGFGTYAQSDNSQVGGGLSVLVADGGNEYRHKYFELPPLGASGPSRQATALAGWAGLLTTPAMQAAARRVFASATIPKVITPYFTFYEQWARAACGEPEAAIGAMRDFVGAQLEENDSATVWEWYEAHVQDFRKWRMDDWPKSLCHGWGGGAVPLATRFLLGIEPAAPGFGRITIGPTARLPWTFEATVPTPHGPIHVRKATPRGGVEYEVPRGIAVNEDVPGNAKIRQR